jgi:hypothetical protein
MSYSTLNRFGGAVVLVSSAAAVLFNAVLWTGIIPRSWEYPGYLALQTLFLFTLVAILIRHVQRAGVLLLVGFALAAIELVFSLGFSYYASFAFPILRDQFPDAVSAVLSGPVGSLSKVMLAVGMLGNILFYAAVLRARQVPRWAPAVVIFSQVLGLAMLPYNIPVIIASIGLAGIGYAMLFPNRQPELQVQAQAAD